MREAAGGEVEGGELVAGKEARVEPEPDRQESEEEYLDAVAGEVEEPVVEGVDVPVAARKESEVAGGRGPAEEDHIELVSRDGGAAADVDGGQRLPPAPPRAGEHRGADDVVDVEAGEDLVENLDGELREKVRRRHRRRLPLRPRLPVRRRVRHFRPQPQTTSARYENLSPSVVGQLGFGLWPSPTGKAPILARVFLFVFIFSF